MRKPVRLDDEAEREIDAAVGWYEQQLAGLGLDLLRETVAARLRVAQAPAACSLVPGVPRELELRRCAIDRFPYSLVFVELEDHIRVLAFAHARRRPLYWRRRVARATKRTRGRPRTGR